MPEPDPASPRLLCVKQLAEILSVSTKTVQRLRDAGKLPRPVRLGRLVRWRRSDIDRFLSRL